MPIIFHIDPADSRPIYMQIMDEVRRAVVVGTASPDSPLPSVRQLASDLRVNPNTVQQAYRELEREGLIYIRRGQGTFIAATTKIANERETIATRLAGQFLRDAYRNGITPDELLAAIQKASDQEFPASIDKSKGAAR
ncbi:GntR family transcriptional regulator [Candidatus Zixiibacteriota bacterium]